MTTIDARGKNCPQPVIMTKALLDRGEKEVKVLLDNPISATNVQRFLEKNLFSVQIEDEDGAITIKGVKADPASEPVIKKKEETKELCGAAIVISKAVLGGEDNVLGEVLMKSFLGTLPQLSSPPSLVVLMNEGVKLALKKASSCDHLVAIENSGTRILVCGTCTNHFGVTADVGVGTISNMFEITEALLAADKHLSL